MVGIVTGGVTGAVSGGIAGTGPTVVASASSGELGWPVHSRNWPQDPQNSSPGWLRKPQLVQIMLAPQADQRLVMSTMTDALVLEGSSQPCWCRLKQPLPAMPRTAIAPSLVPTS